MAREVESLRKNFLPDPFDPIGVYPNAARVQANARAFLVLSHAEVESYLEDWAKEIARAAESVWAAGSRLTPPLSFLLTAMGERLTVPDTLGGQDAPQRLADLVTRVFVKYYKQVKDNNGVKEKNLLSLFVPLGLPSSAIGTTLVQNLDAFGSDRGMHAHHAASVVVTPLDPETEYKRVQNVLNDLLDIDTWLVAYKRRIR
jgi:hypothetical protein